MRNTYHVTFSFCAVELAAICHVEMTVRSLTRGYLLCRTFKAETKVDKVVVLWTANTERYSDVITGLNDTKENLFNSLENGEPEISPSTLFALACIHEGVPFINGSPQNTFVPGMFIFNST